MSGEGALLEAVAGERIADPWLVPHQQTAAARILRILENYPAVLLADEPGLGKSRVATVVAERFRARGVAVRFVVPASLQPQWRRLVAERDLDAEIVTHDTIHAFQWMEREQFIVVDEAHRFRNRATRRHAALARMVVGNRILLITATPFCNSRQDLLSLLALALADDAMKPAGVPSLWRAFDGEEPSQLRRVFSEVVVRRGAGETPGLIFPGLDERVLEVRRNDGFPRLLAQLRELTFPLLTTGGDRGLMLRFLRHRVASSEAALDESLRRLNRFYRKAAEMLVGGQRLSRRDYRRLFGESSEERLYQDVLFPSFWITPQPAGAADAAELTREIARIAQLLEVLPVRTSDKREVLLKLIGREGRWIVFTSAVATARALHRDLRPVRSCGMMTSACCLDAGGRRVQQGVLLEDFRLGRFDVLVATDIGSEGLDLQAADRVVHYDLPWTPSRLDQRNGRSRRIGQEARFTIAYRFIDREESDSGTAILTAKRMARHRLFHSAAGDDSFALGHLLDRALSDRPIPTAGGGLILARQGCGIRMAAATGDRLSDDPSAVAALFSEGPAVDSLTLEEAGRQWEGIACTRRDLPSFLPSVLPQVALARKLEGPASMLRALLRRRYRSGVETMIAEAVAGKLGLAALERILAGEKALEGERACQKIIAFAHLPSTP